MKRRTDGGSRLRDVVSFSLQNLQMDDALFTLLTRRILYTGNACGCEFLCMNVGKLIYFHKHSWFALSEA